MLKLREAALVLMMGACGSFLFYLPVRANEQDPAPPQSAADVQQSQPPASLEALGIPRKLMVTVGKTLIIDSPLNITRVHVANGQVAEAVAVNPKEVLVNGTSPGETSVIVWQQGGARLVYDLTVRMSGVKLEAVRQQIARDFPDEDISVTFENDTAFVRGTVKDVTSATRVMAVAESLGKAVNFLRVAVPPVQPQVVLHVKFANVDRSASLDLGVNLANGSFNQNTAIGTSQPVSLDGGKSFSLSSAVNVLLFRRDINLVAAIQALQTKHLLEMLAEPDLMAISGQKASFLAGGEIPVPIAQPGQGTTVITIMWREYGVRLNFLPNITPRGTIRMKVEPEVSSLDFGNAITIEGTTIPALRTQRVNTEVELDGGQSFVIAGLLDNTTTDNFSKVPGIGSIPVLGKLFQTKSVTRSNTELLVIITPEIVRPIPEGQSVPQLNFTSPFLPNNSTTLRQPGMDKTGPVPVKPPTDSVPFEELVEPPKMGQAPNAPTVPMPGQTAAPVPGAAPAPTAAPAPVVGKSGGGL